jgi:hypothetical protein
MINNKISFINNPNIFIDNDYTSISENMTNKLFCTFTPKDELENILSIINRRYTIMFNKIFVLESKQSDELICTYNIDTGNSNNSIMDNTILVHRKKDYNTLYSINALNVLIKQLNKGILDTSYPINWGDYKNCILLNTGNDLRRLDTSIYKIVNLSLN